MDRPPRLIPVDAPRRQIHILEQMLFTQAHIAEATGVAQSHISRIAAGHTQRVRREIAAKINAGYQVLTSAGHGIKRGPRAGRNHPRVNPADRYNTITGDEARDILAALMTHGHSLAEIAKETGLNEWSLRRVHTGAVQPGEKVRNGIADLKTLHCINITPESRTTN